MNIGIYAKKTDFGQISPEILFKNAELVSISGNLGHFSFLEQPELIELYYLCKLFGRKSFIKYTNLKKIKL